MWRRAKATTVCCLLLLACPIASAQTTQPTQPSNWKTIYADDFEAGNADGWAVSVWEGVGAGWQVVKDSGNWVFAGTGHATADLLAGRWPDFRFKARIKLIQGGLFLNYRTNACERYFLSFNTGPLVLNRSLGCDSNPTLLTVPATHATGRWYTVEMVGIGANLKVYSDGALSLDYTDPNPLLFGGVGLEANPNSQIYVDDVEISGPESSVAETLVWVKTGGPLGGMGYDIRMRSDNPDVMWVTDLYAGANTSNDGGQTWRASNKGIVTRSGPTGDGVPVFSLTISPQDNNVIWAGTQNVRGVYKSVDGGKTWVEKDKGISWTSGITFRGFTVDPRNPNVVYAAGNLSSFVWAGQTELCWDGFDMNKGLVYKTTDGGENWNLIWEGDNLARYVWIDPRDSNVLYVSTGIFDGAPANCDYANHDVYGVGILKSADGGKTWKVLGKANGLTTLRIGSLFMHPVNPDILLAGGGGPHDQPDSGAFLSTDRGETWTRTLASGMENITSVEFATSDPRIAYAGGEGSIYRSDDGGQNWRRVNGPPYGPPGIHAGVPIDIQVDPRNSNRLFINNYGGGNFLSEDGGISWTVASKGYTGAQVHRVSVDRGDPRRVYAVARAGVFRSSNAGNDWDGRSFGPANYPEWYSVAASPADANTVLSAVEASGTLFRSTDAGASWQVVFQYAPLANGVPDYRSGQGFKAIAFAPSNPSVVYAGASRCIRCIDEGWRDPAFGIFKSIDGGATWRDTTGSVVAGQNFNMLAVDPRNENTVYAGTVSGGVFQSVDGGKSWRAMNHGLVLLDVRAVAVDPLNSSVLYAGVENGGLYKSTDGGASWQAASVGMDPQASVRDIAIDPTDSSVVYAGDYRSGAYRSADGGKLWIQINNGLSTRAIKALALSSDGGTLYAATEGEGVFRLDIKPSAETAVSCVSGASFVSGAPLAPESIVSAFGQGLSSDTVKAAGTPLPTALANVSVTLTDPAGTDRAAPLFFVSPGQINFEVPVGTAAGQATVRVLQQNRVVARGEADIEKVSPALFTANTDGKGVPAAVALRVAASGAQSLLDVYRCGTAQGSCAPVPIDLGAATDQVILELFGTGVRGRSALTAVTAKIGGQDADVLYAGPQGDFAGLDQVNVRVPRSLAGHGDVDVVLVVDGKTANTVTVRIL